jgi:hypothetical protein
MALVVLECLGDVLLSRYSFLVSVRVVELDTMSSRFQRRFIVFMCSDSTLSRDSFELRLSSLRV